MGNVGEIQMDLRFWVASILAQKGTVSPFGGLSAFEDQIWDYNISALK